MLSIITPVLNGATYIEKNIRSVRNLSLPTEHIIVDGGSTDETVSIVKEFKEVKLLHQSLPDGMYGAIDEGIKISKGEYVSWLNADDLYTSGIEKLYQVIKDKNADLIYGDTDYHFIKEGRIERFYASPSAKFFLKNGCFPLCQSSSIFSKRIYEYVGGFRAKDFKVCGDLDLYQRIAFLKHSKILYEPVVASVFLKYGSSLGDRSAELYKHERHSLLCYKEKNLSIKVSYKLMRLISKYLYH